MNQQSIYRAVGGFVIAAIIAFFYISTQFSNKGFFKQHRTYQLKAVYDNVTGLRIKAPIRVAGVRIGQITGIDLNPKDYTAIITMQIEDTYHVPKDSTFSIYTEGLLGVKFVAVIPGFDQKMLKSGDHVMKTKSTVILEELLSGYLMHQKNEAKS